MTPPRYPHAKWQPLLGHSLPGTVEQRNTIVLHISEGGTAAGVYATFLASKAPHRVSAHFCVDRDGTVYQYLEISETAWHASQVNTHSIGIEHVCLSAAGAAALNHAHVTSSYGPLLATEAQYAASGRLVAWLCGQLGIPIDRAHIREHCEASPRDGHTGCCHAALDPDRVVLAARNTP